MNLPNNTLALIVDDNPENRLIFDVCLRNAGYKTVEAGDGKEALSILERYPSIKLMILDLQMPVMSGVEVLEQMEKHPQYRSLYVMVVTANVHMTRGTLVQQRANEIMYKPVNPPEFTLYARRLREQWSSIPAP